MILDGAALDLALHGEPSDPRTYLLRFYPDLTIPPLDRVADLPPLAACISAGYWIAVCPCGADGVPAPGGVVWLDRPLIWCIRCENASAGGDWRRVAGPAAEDRAAIEAVLICRPDPLTRNWAPGESVADLIAENVAHGVPVPEGG